MLAEEYLQEWNQKTNSEKDEILKVLKRLDGTFLQLVELYEFFKKMSCNIINYKDAQRVILLKAIKRAESLSELDYLEEVSAYNHFKVIHKRKLELAVNDLTSLKHVLRCTLAYPLYCKSIIERILALGISFDDQLEIFNYFQSRADGHLREDSCMSAILEVLLSNMLSSEEVEDLTRLRDACSDNNLKKVVQERIMELVLPNIIYSINSIYDLIKFNRICPKEVRKSYVQSHILELAETVNDLKVIFFYVAPTSFYRIKLLKEVLPRTTNFNELYFIHNHFHRRIDQSQVFILMEKAATSSRDMEILESIRPTTLNEVLARKEYYNPGNHYEWNFWDWYNAHSLTDDIQSREHCLEKMIELAEGFWEIRMVYVNLEEGHIKEDMLQRMKELMSNHDEVSIVQGILKQ